jgi:MFS family permease
MIVDLSPAGPRVRSLRAIAAATASGVVAVLPVYLLGALAVLVREELGFSARHLGAAVSLFYLVSALLSVPGGRLGDRLGPSRALRLACAGCAVACLLVAAAAVSYAWLLAMLVLAAAANALAQPATNLALAREVPVWRQGLAFGIKQGSGPAATLLAGLAVPAVGLTVGWRWAYVVAALLCLAPVLATPSHVPVPPLGRALRRDGDLSGRSLVLLAAAISLAVASAASLGAFFVESAVALGHPVGAAGIWLAVGSVASIAARLWIGWKADQRGSGHLRTVVALLVAGSLGFGLLGHAEHPVVLATAALVAFAAGWGWPGLYQYAVVKLNPRAPGEATGVLMAGMFTGGTVGPFAFGMTADHVSYQAAWWGAALALLGGAALVVAGRRAVRRDLARSAATPVDSLSPPVSGGPVPPPQPDKA